jgi:uncharacterized membrane protein
MSAPSPGPGASRIPAIDAVRGLVMVIMALDHVRDFIHRGAMSFQPTDLTKTSAALFFTRWVTHICAPAFMLTAGMGAYLWWRRAVRTRGQLSRFLLTRGLWLILLELTVMRLAYDFDLAQRYPWLLLVLWVLGACMVVLAALVWLPVPLLATLSVAVIVLHNRFDPIQAASLGAGGWAWNLLHQVGAFQVAGATVIVGYPLMPWVAVMALGFCLGSLYLLEPPARQRLLVAIGAAATLGFVVLRTLNGYGDPAPWSAQPVSGFTVLSFLNTTKYPPSLAFLLMTVGPTLLLLAAFEKLRPSAASPLVVFGRVPLFYFVLHFYLAHIASALLALAQYGAAAIGFIFHPVPSMGGPARLYPPDFGWSLAVAYLVWIAVVLSCYPVCRHFARLKASRTDWWLSYL